MTRSFRVLAVLPLLCALSLLTGCGDDKSATAKNNSKPSTQDSTASAAKGTGQVKTVAQKPPTTGTADTTPSTDLFGGISAPVGQTGTDQAGSGQTGGGGLFDTPKPLQPVTPKSTDSSTSGTPTSEEIDNLFGPPRLDTAGTTDGASDAEPATVDAGTTEETLTPDALFGPPSTTAEETTPILPDDTATDPTGAGDDAGPLLPVEPVEGGSDDARLQIFDDTTPTESPDPTGGSDQFVDPPLGGSSDTDPGGLFDDTPEMKDDDQAGSETTTPDDFEPFGGTVEPPAPGPTPPLGTPPAEEPFGPSEPLFPAEPKSTDGAGPDEPTIEFRDPPIDTADADPARQAALGVRVVRVSEPARRRWGITIPRGAVIHSLHTGSPADRAALPIGSVISKIDDAAIDSPHDLVSYLKTRQPGDAVDVEIQHGSRNYTRQIQLAAANVAFVDGGRLGSTNNGGATKSSDGAGSLEELETIIDGSEETGEPADFRPRGTTTDQAATIALQRKVVELETELDEMRQRVRQLEQRLLAQ